MAAVIRIKRPLNTEPLDTLILNCKRRRTDESPTEDTSGNLSTVLKFAATVENQEEDVFKYVKKPTKSDLKEQFKRHVVDIDAKMRDEFALASKSSRYKVINQFRSTSREQPEDGLCTVVDLEDDAVLKTDAEQQADQFKFVYDLYYTSSDDFGDADFNECVSVYPLSDSLVYDNHVDSDVGQSDDDSNAENDWKNDYPDEPDYADSDASYGELSVNEDDMISAVRRVNLAREDNDDLSSDDYIDDYERERSETLDFVDSDQS